MKNTKFWKLVLGLSLGALPLAGGCLQQNPGQSSGTEAAITSPAAVAEPVVDNQGQTEVAEAGPAEGSESDAAEPDAPPLDQLAQAPVQPVSTNQPVPAKVRLTPAAGELVRLANSGVDEGVMLAYVTNSSSLFSLGADEIIYLNDMGVPSPVVTAMIQRDEALKGSGAASVVQAPPVTALPPPPEPAPAPAGAEVAQGPVTAPLTPPANYPLEVAPAPAVAAPVADVSYDTFYDSLAPYGTWVYVSGYGRCWRPSAVVVNPGWQPYFDCGHWVYTDCGWYWMSDYSWGWAPFHYGRWFHHASWGWCWAPGTVWGPSWVAWRHTSDYCGWAPLPPGVTFSFSIGLTFHGHHVRDWDDCGLRPAHYRFVAWNHFDNHRLHNYAVSRTEVTRIYNRSVVVNQITINNHTVVNRGIPRERVAAATHRDIRPLAIREASFNTRSGTPAGRAERVAGNTLTVYRPETVKPNANRTAGGGAHTKPVNRNAGTFGGNNAGRAQSAIPANSAERAPSYSNRPGNGNRNQNNVVRDGTQPGTRNQGSASGRNQPSGRNENARPGYRSSAPMTTPGRNAAVSAPLAPSAPSALNNRTGVAANEVPRQAPANARPGTTPTWRTADPANRFERFQPPARQYENQRPQNNNNNYNNNNNNNHNSRNSQRSEVPRYSPSTSFGAQRPFSQTPRYTVSPSYNTPRFSPAERGSSSWNYSRPESGGSRQVPSYSGSQRYSAPAASAPSASRAESRPMPAPSRGDSGSRSGGGDRGGNHGGGGGGNHGGGRYQR